MGKPNRPNYSLGAMLKGETRDESMRATIGAGWLNDDGSISIKLDPFVVLQGSNPDLVLRLFPREVNE